MFSIKVRCTSVLARGRHNFNRENMLSEGLLIFCKGGKCHYTLLAVKLALPLRAACVQHSGFCNHESIPWQKVLFTKHLIICSFGVTPDFTSLFRTAGSPSECSSFGLPGSGVSRGKLLMQNTALKLPTLPQPGVRDSQDRSLKTCSALCQGAMAVLSTGQSSHTGTHQVTNPGAWSPFLLLLPRSRSTKHLFVIPVPNEEALGQLGKISTVTSVDALDLYYR